MYRKIVAFLLAFTMVFSCISPAGSALAETSKKDQAHSAQVASKGLEKHMAEIAQEQRLDEYKAQKAEEHKKNLENEENKNRENKEDKEKNEPVDKQVNKGRTVHEQEPVRDEKEEVIDKKEEIIDKNKEDYSEDVEEKEELVKDRDTSLKDFGVFDSAYKEFELGAGETAVVKFIPSESCDYKIYSTGSEDTYITLYDNDLNVLASNDDGGSGNNFSLSYSFEANHTYYFYIRFYSSSQLGVIPVYIEQFDAYDLDNCTTWFYGVIFLGMDIDKMIHLSRVSNEDIVLESGRDYVLSQFINADDYDSDEYSESQWFTNIPTKAGHYYAKAVGMGQYHGELIFSFYLRDPYDISEYCRDFYDIYLGDSINDALYIYRYDYDDDGDFTRVYLEEGKAYKITGYMTEDAYEADDGENSSWSVTPPSKAGYYYAKAEGIGDYYGTIIIWFAIYDHYDISSMYRSYVDIFSGDSIEDTLYLYWYDSDENEHVLRLGTDFIITGYMSEEMYEDDHDESDWSSEHPNEPGYYYVKTEGIGEYHGTKIISFRIKDRYDIINMYSSYTDFYSGESIADSLSLYWWDRYDHRHDLRLGTDFIISGYMSAEVYDSDDYDESDWSSEHPNEPGYYYVRTEGIGEYHGTKTIWFEIYDRYDIKNMYWNCDDIYIGETIADSLYLSWYDRDDKRHVLRLGTDFIITGYMSSEKYDSDDYDESNWTSEHPNEAGEYVVRTEGIGEYHGTKTIWFDIYDPYDIRNMSCSYDDIYSGESIEDSLYLYWYDRDDNRHRLRLGTDFIITGYMSEEKYESDDYNETDWSSEHPTEPGEYCVRTEGIGNYYGTNIIWFYVYDRNDIGYMDYNYADIYRGESIEDYLSLYWWDRDDKKHTLRLGTDFIITGYMSEEKYESDDYNETDWSSEHPNEYGYYYARTEGIGNYHGTRIIGFSIYDPYDISSMDYDYDDIYSGESIEDSLYLYWYDRDDNRHKLRLGTEFIITGYMSKEKYESDDYDEKDWSSEHPNDPGRYCVKTEGIGKYHGIRIISFSVLDHYDLRHMVSDCNNISIGESVVDSIYLAWFDRNDDEHTLVLGTDYIITGYISEEKYESEDYDETDWTAEHPTEPGYYYVRLEGIGAYYGTKLIDFRISDPYDIKSADIYVRGIVFAGDKLTDHLEIYDEDGTSLEYGSDYTIEGYSVEYSYDSDEHVWVDRMPNSAGMYSAKIKGMGSYRGSAIIYFTLYNKKEYGVLTSDHMEFELDAYDIAVVKYVPDQTGYCTIYSESDQDTYVELYDSDNERIASNDDSGDGGNFKLKEKLYKNENYYYYIRFYDSDDSGVIPVHFEAFDPFNIENYYCVSHRILTGESISDYVQIYTESNQGRSYLVNGRDYEIACISTRYSNLEDRSEEDWSTYKAEASGWYYVLLKGKGKYKGELELDYYVADPYDIEEVSAYTMTDSPFIGTAIQDYFTLVFKNGHEGPVRLTYGVDFEITGYSDDDGDSYKKAEPSSPGEYLVRIEGIGKYHGTKCLYFDYVDPAKLESYEGISTYYGSFSAQDYVLTNGNEKYALKNGKDYRIAGYADYVEDVSYDAYNWKAGTPSTPGDYVLKIEGIGAYSGTIYRYIYVCNLIDRGNLKDTPVISDWNTSNTYLYTFKPLTTGVYLFDTDACTNVTVLDESKKPIYEYYYAGCTGGTFRFKYEADKTYYLRCKLNHALSNSNYTVTMVAEKNIKFCAYELPELQPKDQLSSSLRIFVPSLENKKNALSYENDYTIVGYCEESSYSATSEKGTWAKEQPEEAGTYYVRVKGLGAYWGYKDIKFDIVTSETVVANGFSGNTTWKLTDTGKITFSGNGKMRNYNTKTEMPWYSYADQIKKAVFEEGVTSVGENAFNGFEQLKSVEFADSVTLIDDYAFKNCTALDNVDLPNKLTKLGGSAFYGCTSLKSIAIPEGIYTVWEYCFKNCTALDSVTLPKSLIKLGEAAFYGCSALTSIEIPDNCSIIDVYCFKNCTNLSDVKLPATLGQFREAVFYATAIPSLDVPSKVTSVGPYAFKKCTSLTSINLPESLTKIDEAAFYECDKLSAIDIPDAVTTIGNYAFRRCTGLSSVEFPAGLKTVGECSFYGCTGLSELEIPEGTSVIKPYAFKACSNLLSIALPGTLTTLGESSLNSCTSLVEITIPASVTAIEDYCFSGNTLLKNVTFEGSAPAIGTGAFKNVTAKVFYPSGDASWTSEVMKNYGGNLTWKAQ